MFCQFQLAAHHRFGPLRLPQVKGVHAGDGPCDGKALAGRLGKTFQDCLGRGGHFPRESVTGTVDVQQVAEYGLKDGIVVNYCKGERPAGGKDLTFLEQIFGNISNRQMFKDNTKDANGIPGPGL